MASTFTSQKDIEKPGQGEQSGVWGVTANRNYDKIDANLAAITSVNALVSTTLQTSQSAVSESDAAILVLSGNIGATSVTRTLTLPSGRSGKYIVNSSQVTFGNSIYTVRGDVTDSGVALTSVTDRTITIFSNGTSVFRTNQETANAVESVSPIVGEVRMYAPAGGTIVSAALPNGWHVANGNNGTNDLRGRFIYATCVGSQTGDTGGANTQTISTSIAGSVGDTALTEAQLPAHTHGMFRGTTTSEGGLGSSDNVAAVGSFGNNGSYVMSPGTGGQVGITTSTGSGASHSHSLSGVEVSTNFDNRPSFFRLVFIQFTGT